MSRFSTLSLLCMYIAGWLVMLCVSVANGLVREITYGGWMSELAAHQVSTVVGMAALGVVIWLFMLLVPPSSGRQAVALGLFWAGLTIAFEFLFFHYLGGHSWNDLLSNYNVLAGRIWVFLILWIAAAPFLFFRFGLVAKEIPAGTDPGD